MALFTLRGVRKSFGSRLILDGLDLNVEDGARIGIVGGNGSGKSTLLRIMAGDEDTDAGASTRRKGLTLALLPQHPLGDKRTARETLQQARSDLRSIDTDLAQVNADLASPSVHENANAMEQALKRQADLLERYERAGGPAFEGRARSLLIQLGLEERELDLPTRVLSGGQRKLIGLAACVIQDPELLCSMSRRPTSTWPAVSGWNGWSVPSRGQS